jgi:hypothetical protein
LLVLCGALTACPEIAERHGRAERVARARLQVDLADLPAAGRGGAPAAAARPPARDPDAPLTPTAPADEDAGPRRPDNGRPILAPYLVNARDLGGTPVAQRGVVPYGRLFRGPPVAALSADGCSAFANLGIHTVVDLRVPSEVQSTPEAACVRERTAIVLAPLPVPYSVSPQDYIADLDAYASIAAVFRVLGAPTAYPVYFHCTWGRDRTGIVAALILLALGASRDDIVEEYLLSSASVGAYPRSLVAALEEVERRGGIESYLTAVGVTPEQLAALRLTAVATLP